MVRALLVCALLLAPFAAGQHAHSQVGGMAPPPPDTGYTGPPILVPLYAHVYDLLQKSPMNTQPMIDLDLARGFGSPSVTRTGPLPGAFPDSNHLYLYSSPGLVEYNETDERGLPRYHPERGISYDVLLDPSASIVGHWFMSAKALDVPQVGLTDGPEAGLMPAFTVRMTMRSGDDIGADLDAGEIIAQGEATLADPTTWLRNNDAIEFVVDMGAPRVDRILGDEAFNVKVEWFNAKSPDDVRVTQRDWILHTGERYPNRIELTVVNPLAVYYVHPQPVGFDLLAIHTEFNSPLGNYDVDAATLSIEVTGPTAPTRIAEPLVVQKSYGHNHHYEPVQVTWAWPYKEDAAKPGTYRVTVRGTNLQGTATVEKTASFVIPEEGRAIGYDDQGGLVQATEDGEAKDTPAPALGALLAAFAAAAMVLTRRRA